MLTKSRGMAYTLDWYRCLDLEEKDLFDRWLREQTLDKLGIIWMEIIEEGRAIRALCRYVGFNPDEEPSPWIQKQVWLVRVFPEDLGCSGGFFLSAMRRRPITELPPLKPPLTTH